MKKYILFIALSFFAVTSCTDLEVLPEDASTELEIFNNLDAYRSYLAKVYGSYSLTGQDGPHGEGDISIVSDEGFTSYIRVYWKAQEITTDEAVIAWTDAGIQDMHNHVWSSENQFVRVLYYRIAEINLYRAEVRFLRALAYWHALDLFRNIPLAETISTDLPVQATPQALFDFIESELSEVESILPEPRQGEYGRVDKAALWMLQAKLYLNAESMLGTPKYTECLSACNKVLGAGYQ